MMKKLAYIIPALALVLFSTCDSDFEKMDVGLNGKWLALNGTQMELAGMSYTHTSAYGDVDTGTYSAAGGYITFSRIGHTSETVKYSLDFPELVIGGVTYYHDSPNEPLSIEGRWIPYPGESSAVTFYPGKRIKDENKKETYDIEGEFKVHFSSRGRYTISRRNLPGQSTLVTVPTHFHGTILFMYINIRMPIDLLPLFDQTILTPPENFEDVAEWWWTVDELRKYFEEAASKSADLTVQAQVFAAMRSFLSQNDASRYDYTLEYDEDIPTIYEGVDIIDGGYNKLTLRTQAQGIFSAGIYTYYYVGPGEE